MQLSKYQHIESSVSTHFIHEVRLEYVVCDSAEFKRNWTTSELESIAIEIEDSPAPVILEKIDTTADQTEPLYRILFGTKYFIAANILQWETLPALVLQNQQNQSVREFLSHKVFNWDHLDEIECARAYEWLRTVCHYTVDKIASMRNISRPVIGNQLRLLKLPSLVQDYLQNGLLRKSHCFELLKLDSAQRQIALAKEVADGLHSVRELKAIVETELHTPQTIEKNPPQPNFQIEVQEASIQIHCDSLQKRDELLAYLREFR